ncbi:MAG: DNA alkylation response protein, partial [Xanthomonadales bacterium]|nr:DNA alkylation response protein [Xanthomonadales bacterium]
EGSGNVQCLDMLRALRRDPATREALLAELQGVRGESPVLDAEVRRIEQSLRDEATLEVRARRIIEHTALALQAVQLLRSGRSAVSGAFIASRLGGHWGQNLGTLEGDVPFQDVIDASFPSH